MVKAVFVFLSVLSASSLALAENIECVSSDQQIRLEMSEQPLVLALEDEPSIEVGKASIYSLSYKDIQVRYGQVSTEADSYAKDFDHEAARFQIDGDTVVFLAESDAELLKFHTLALTPQEKEMGVLSKLKLKSANIYFGRNVNTQKVESTDVPASILLCTQAFSD